jgi:hypothetical protein
MNNTLKKEIITHILKTIGVIADQQTFQLSMMEKLNSNKFLLDKKLAFENEDGKSTNGNLYAATAKVENSNVNIMIADITDEIKEVALIISMDTMSACAIRISADEDDFGSMFMNIEGEHWIAAPTIQQAKTLICFESLPQLFLQWEKLEDYGSIYKSMVGFLNFYEEQDI